MTGPDTPLQAPDDDTLAGAVSENLFALFRAMLALPGAVLHEGDGCSMHHATPTNPMFKGIWGLRRGATGTREALGEALAWQQARGAPFAFVWAASQSMPGDMEDATAALGLEPFDVGSPCQVADLDALDWEARDRVPAGLTIEAVAEDRALVQFGQVFSDALGVPDWAGQAWVDATRAVGIGRTPWVPYLARLGGAPVATTIGFTGAGVASVFGVATLERERGRGIGAAITLAGLEDARASGYRHAVLFATDLGAPVYRRLGFRDVDATISRWLWRAG